MSTKGTSTSRTELRHRITALETHVEQIKGERERAREDADQWKERCLEESQRAAQGLQVKMENDRLNQREKLVALIAAGKNLEAINFLLTAQVMLFKVNVRFADDNARNKAEDEMLQRVVRIATTALAQVRINREAKDA